MSREVVYDYDSKGDSLFIYCVEDYEYEVSFELDNDIILDIDSEGQPVAFEFLNASKIFNLDKGFFKNLAKISIRLIVTEKKIDLKVYRPYMRSARRRQKRQRLACFQAHRRLP